MPTYVRDNTGRFQQRPHYKPEELDEECETLISGFLNDLHGNVRYPIVTEDLKKLIERDAEYLDVYADLSHYGSDVEGVTEFSPNGKPRVLISALLTESEQRENRLRTTLTHEYGHVHFHSYLWQMELSAPDLLRQQSNRGKEICKRGTITDAPQNDWMEWQAGYVCGAILMPKSAVVQLVRDYAEQHRLYGVISEQTQHGRNVIDRIVSTFQVSEDAARIRLLKINLLTTAPPTQALFN
jgi:Zn-dependent peptidase ImmA (M78 family)